jgi:glycosyltransferase involved in cell wall biosynthesis
MRILINAFSARQGGGQTYLKNLLEFLPEELKLKVFLLVPQNLWNLANGSGITVIRTRWPMENPIVRAIWEKFRLPSVIKGIRADVLFCPGGIIGVKPHPTCKTVTMFRNMIPFDLPIRKRYPLGYMRTRNWILERLMLKSMINADLVVFVSEFAKGVIERRCGGRLRRTVVIPHGVNKRFFRDPNCLLRAPDWLPPDGYFLYVSTLDVYKAQVEVIRGYVLAKKRIAFPQKLLLCGPEYPEYARRVREEIKSLGAEDDVIIAGSIPYEELPAVYQHATVNIFASESENCPNILLEALAAGCPILCSDRPPMPEFGGDAVAYFDPGSPEILATKLSAFLNNPLEMRRLSDRAVERARRYDWGHAAHLTWQAIAKLA